MTLLMFDILMGSIAALAALAVIRIMLGKPTDNPRPLVNLICDSIRTEPGWVFQTGGLELNEGESSYDPHWVNHKLGLTVWTIDHTVVCDNDEAFEMTGAEVSAFEDAVLDREERLLKRSK